MVFHRSETIKGYGEKMKDLHKRIDEWGAEVSVSFHFNAFGVEAVNGHEILYHSKGGKKLAKKMDKIFDIYLDNRDRNIKQRNRKQRGGGFLSRGKSLCILVEPFFASHQDRFMDGGERQNLLTSFVEFLT